MILWTTSDLDAQGAADSKSALAESSSVKGAVLCQPAPNFQNESYIEETIRRWR